MKPSLMKHIRPLAMAAFATSLSALADASTHNPANPWPDDYKHVMSMDSCAAWGTYNVHDPSCLKIGDYYYMYSTDAIFGQRLRAPGYIQMRRSADLVNWEFLGWAFPEIPYDAYEWVKRKAGGVGAGNIWAPYITIAPDGKFRLYYCVSAFGLNTSYIGLAESDSPVGPWTQKGCVVRTEKKSRMNAIDPSVVTDKDGRVWMHYGSYFGGLFCVELDPATGLPLQPGDRGHLVARRANPKRDNLEAPEIVYSPEQDYYYLFQSYDPLMTTYNVRVGRSRKAEGPFTDFNGVQISDTTDNFPILTAPYRFDGHPGWVGTAHCSVFKDNDGHFYMAHQGRLASNSEMMDLHVRRLFFTPDGWPVVSPERYAGVEQRQITANEIKGKWEIIHIREPRTLRKLESGQILWGEGNLLKDEWNDPLTVDFSENETEWHFSADTQTIDLKLGENYLKNLITFVGHDWEKGKTTILFTGLDSKGCSVWGKRIAD